MQGLVTKREYVKGWRQIGYADGFAKRPARAPLRDDDGVAKSAYQDGYRTGTERRRALARA